MYVLFACVPVHVHVRVCVYECVRVRVRVRESVLCVSYVYSLSPTHMHSDPMGTRAKRVEEYMKKEKKHKHLIFVLNKCDLVPTWATVRLLCMCVCVCVCVWLRLTFVFACLFLLLKDA